MRQLAPLTLLLALGACAIKQVEHAACPAGLSAQQQARLYFGLTSVGGMPIPEAGWRSFVASEVTPRFPQGLTAIDTTGQWRDRVGGMVIRQPSRVIEIIASDDPVTIAKLNAIREAYRARFQQQSVGLALLPVCAGF